MLAKIKQLVKWFNRKFDGRKEFISRALHLLGEGATVYIDIHPTHGNGFLNAKLSSVNMRFVSFVREGDINVITTYALNNVKRVTIVEVINK
jgi:hypothetical protein